MPIGGQFAVVADEREIHDAIVLGHGLQHDARHAEHAVVVMGADRKQRLSSWEAGLVALGVGLGVVDDFGAAQGIAAAASRMSISMRSCAS